MNDGGPAFPNDRYGDNGMTLRDYFAAQALPAVIAAMNQDVLNRRGEHYTQNDIAAKSYIIADMMLAERAK